MEHVAYYPDPVNLNLTHGDPKGHYKWSISYYDLAKTAFPPDRLPHFLQGEEYAHLNMSFCARRGVSDDDDEFNEIENEYENENENENEYENKNGYFHDY